MKRYTIYGSGDPGTKSLRVLFDQREMPYGFVETRVAVGGSTAPLAFLILHHLITVPQAVADGV